MAVVRTKVIFPYSIQKVWKVVTSIESYAWRSDLVRAERCGETQFLEEAKGGAVTVFTTEKIEPYKCWSFRMENRNITGRWTGLFTEEGGQTQLDCTEEATAKRWILRPLVKLYLKRQQKQFITDLQNALSK